MGGLSVNAILYTIALNHKASAANFNNPKVICGGTGGLGRARHPISNCGVRFQTHLSCKTHSHPSAKKSDAAQRIIIWGVILTGASIWVSGLSVLFPFQMPRWPDGH